MTVICPTCGSEEPDGSRFCGSCGAPFADAAPQIAPAENAEETTSTCPSCGSEEPEGSRFCGSCGASLTGPESAVALPRAAAAANAEASPRIEAPVAAPAAGRSRLLRFAAAAIAALLVAGGVVATLLLRSDGEGSSEVVPTAPQPPPQPGTTSETAARPATPTLAESITPGFQSIAAAQDALDDRLRSLTAGVQSFAALRTGAAALATSLVQTKQVADGLTPTDAAEAKTLPLLRQALEAHLAYADALLSFPPLPRSLTDAQARAAVARAEEAQQAYARLAFADAGLPSVFVSTAGSPRLLAVVPAPEPTPSVHVRRVVDLVPLLVGVRPDDPPGEGRCFGAYTARASLRVSGVVHRSGFIQCGDDANGDPGRATGEYRFSGSTFPPGSRLVRVKGQVAIDESSSLSQRGSAVTWTAFYDGRPICSQTVVWSGSRPSPRQLDCSIPSSASAGAFDVRRLRIRQVASPASSGSLWAGLLHPTIVVEAPH